MAAPSPSSRERIAHGVMAAGLQGVHIRELARRLGMSAPAVAEQLRRLEAEGAVTRRAVGRSLVYSPAPPRRITRGFPASEADWDRRPYFLWSEDRSWRELRDDLRAVDDGRRRRAFEVLLNGARWADIWRLVALDEVARELPHLRLRQHGIWSELIRVATDR